MYVCRFQNVVLRCPTPRLHCFLSSHWPSFSFLSFMVFLIPSIQFFFGLSRALFCFGIHFNAILGNLPSAILWIWPYHVSWFCSISFIIGSSKPIFLNTCSKIFGLQLKKLKQNCQVIWYNGVNVCYVLSEKCFLSYLFLRTPPYFI